MSDAPLVLSLFPGIGLLDLAFEEEGFCIVRGPDVLWGGDVRRFHPPADRFDGVIGGPPCQAFSRMRHINPLAGQRHGNLIPEYERVVAEARPDWFLMENVPEAPEPVVAGYAVRSLVLDNRWLPVGEDGVGPEQRRRRRFTFGTPDGRGLPVEVAVFEHPVFRHAALANDSRAVPVKLGGSGKVKSTWKPRGPVVVAGHGNPPSQRDGGDGNVRDLAEMCRLQGLPEGFADELPFTTHGKRRVIGNGVPLPMGRAIARAVKRALSNPHVALTSVNGT